MNLQSANLFITVQRSLPRPSSSHASPTRVNCLYQPARATRRRIEGRTSKTSFLRVPCRDACAWFGGLELTDRKRRRHRKESCREATKFEKVYVLLSNRERAHTSIRISPHACWHCCRFDREADSQVIFEQSEVLLKPSSLLILAKEIRPCPWRCWVWNKLTRLQIAQSVRFWQ